MMSRQYIEEMSRRAARESCRLGKLPFVVWPEDLAAWKAALAAGKSPRLPFPALGDRNPRGFKLVQEHFVDSSGWGRPGEPALTIEQFIEVIKPGLAYSLGDCGQFQLYVREWKPGPRAMQENADEKNRQAFSKGGEVFADNDHEPVILVMEKRS